MPVAPGSRPPALSGGNALRTVRGLLPFLWPAGDPATRIRVLAALALLVLAKVATVLVPIAYSRAVDRLSHRDPTHVLAVPVALIVGYGLLRIAAGGFGELRDAVFAPVKQRVIRIAAMRTFTHLHALSLRFHLDRQTGGVTR
ncbi:MAG: metal ABC transporter permease, partial [Gluconacetobacter diazotrophicus]|nr:metal ABC transporter permease [Gluconacetobacter diazotrophicus]